MKKQQKVFIAAGVLLYFLYKITASNMKKKFVGILPKMIIRIDNAGSGKFGSSRGGGSRAHAGVDYLCTPGETVYSPISAKIIRSAKPYANDPNYSGLVLQNNDFEFKLFYMKGTPGIIGKTVNAGDPIGTAQDISQKYGGSMQPHIHLEMRGAGGQLLNPESNYLF
jgi:murein DD-endopeptidase MepM/ murein hydrolase activator NlpD